MAEINTAPVSAGWNVWSVYQVDDLGDLNPLNLGLDRGRRLRIWVEDAVRLGLSTAAVADPVQLKGSMVEELAGPPVGLTVRARKEQVSGPAMLVDGPATLRYVRFYNRGKAGEMVWPHDDEYLLNEVFQPSATNPVTNAPPPATAFGGLADAAGAVADKAITTVEVIGGIVAILLGLKFLLGDKNK